MHLIWHYDFIAYLYNYFILRPNLCDTLSFLLGPNKKNTFLY